MRPLALAALGVAAYGAFLVAGIPAAFVAARVNEYSASRIQLTDPRGTLWNGAGAARVAFAHAAPVAVDALTWRWRPVRLLAGELAFAANLSAAGIQAELEVARTFSGWELRDVSARGEAVRVGAMLPFISTWQPGGALALAAPRLAWSGQALAGSLTLEWRGATTALSPVRPLGSYRAALGAEGNPARFTVATLEGPLRVQGSGTASTSARLAFTGEARGEGAQAADLEPLLQLLGRKRADGAYAIDWRAPS